MIPDNCTMDCAHVQSNTCLQEASTSHDDLSQYVPQNSTSPGRPLASSTPTPPGGAAGTKSQGACQTFFRPWESSSTKKVMNNTHNYEQNVSTTNHDSQMGRDTSGMPIHHYSQLAQCMESHPGGVTSYEQRSSNPYSGRCSPATADASVNCVSSAKLSTQTTLTPYQGILPLRLDHLFCQKQKGNGLPNKIPDAKPKKKRATKTIRILAEEKKEDSGYQSNTCSPNGLGTKNGKKSPPEESETQNSFPKFKKLPPAAVQLMESWYRVNFDNPYPSPEVIKQLAVVGNVMVGQVKKWMANKRVRSFNTLSFNGAVHPKKRRRLEREQAERHASLTHVARVFPMQAAGFVG